MAASHILLQLQNSGRLGKGADLSVEGFRIETGE
jgi:hypothetical protein